MAEAFPDAGLAPTDDERADYYRWLFFAAGPLEAAITNKSMGFTVDPDKERMAGYGNYDQVVDVLDQKLSVSDYICGDRFTMADVYVGAHVDWGQQFGSLPERDSFQAYARRLRDRAAYKASKAVDAALLPDQPTG
ncbi:glutathione binding-like protein [Parasphingorhabdus sp. JC815]|uniref:glutathione binding-like protein n=1 Tax=Parasphingorhabdus sp. JC815 TaxID=3232140 RepID=UPI003458A251